MVFFFFSLSMEKGKTNKLSNLLPKDLEESTNSENSLLWREVQIVNGSKFVVSNLTNQSQSTPLLSSLMV